LFKRKVLPIKAAEAKYNSYECYPIIADVILSILVKKSQSSLMVKEGWLEQQNAVPFHQVPSIPLQHPTNTLLLFAQWV